MSIQSIVQEFMMLDNDQISTSNGPTKTTRGS
uniref:Uncharacterized protein n=1 Tax=Rhizophora mucronata TaxID=61149 RepID=A0A2P2IUU3_RHIMU